MIIGVHHLGSEFTTEDFDSTVRDNFVGVHVGLGTGTGLPDDKGEVVVKLALNDLVSGLDNSIGNSRLKTKVEVGLGGTLFEKTESLDNGERHTLTLTSNLEVLERPLSLGTPVTISRNVDGTKSI